jgi:imidazolonepropionase-like amidohydrolase
MKSYEEHQKLVARARDQKANGEKVDPKLMRDKAQAFQEYRKEVREAARKGVRIVRGVDRNPEKRGPTKRSLQEEYVRKLSDKSLPKTEDNPRGVSPRQLAKERLGV